MNYKTYICIIICLIGIITMLYFYHYLPNIVNSESGNTYNSNLINKIPDKSITKLDSLVSQNSDLIESFRNADDLGKSLHSAKRIRDNTKFFTKQFLKDSTKSANRLAKLGEKKFKDLIFYMQKMIYKKTTDRIQDFSEDLEDMANKFANDLTNSINDAISQSNKVINNLTQDMTKSIDKSVTQMNDSVTDTFNDSSKIFNKAVKQIDKFISDTIDSIQREGENISQDAINDINNLGNDLKNQIKNKFNSVKRQLGF